MSQSLLKSYVHAIFNIKCNSPKKYRQDKYEFYAYMVTLAKKN